MEKRGRGRETSYESTQHPCLRDIALCVILRPRLRRPKGAGFPGHRMEPCGLQRSLQHSLCSSLRCSHCIPRRKFRLCQQTNRETLGRSSCAAVNVIRCHEMEKALMLEGICSNREVSCELRAFKR